MSKKKLDEVQRAIENKKAAIQNGEDISKFPSEFPFWARLKICKNRTTLVIDEDRVFDKQKGKEVEGFVHRESTSIKHKGLEEIKPNPDKSKTDSMYLKRPSKLPKRLFKPHNKELDMPEKLRQRYEHNNHKEKPAEGKPEGNQDKKT